MSARWLVVCVVLSSCGESNSRSKPRANGVGGGGGEGGRAGAGRGGAGAGNAAGGAAGFAGTAAIAGDAGSGAAGKSNGGSGGGAPVSGGSGGTGNEAGEPSVDAGAGGDDQGTAPDGETKCDVESGGTIVISSAADLEQLAAQACNVIDGSLTISGAELTDLGALAPSTIHTIVGDLQIENNPSLTSVAGLSGLGKIGGSLVVQMNVALANLAGLESLKTLGSDPFENALVVASNASLASLDALGSADLAVSPVISGNDVLEHLTGLEHLTRANGVTIVNCPALVDLDGLQNLDTCEGATFAGDPELTSLSLPGLTRAGTFGVTGLPALATVSLPQLEKVDSSLTIVGNSVLDDIGTLEALTSIGMLSISGNPMLSHCIVDALDARLHACNSSCGGNDEAASCDN